MDEYTKHTIKNGLSRRGFLSKAALGSMAAGFWGLSGCKPNSPDKKAFNEDLVYGKSSDEGGMLSFLPKPEKINDADIDQTIKVDVVVVGAGASGVPAALSAFEN